VWGLPFFLFQWKINNLIFPLIWQAALSHYQDFLNCRSNWQLAINLKKPWHRFFCSDSFVGEIYHSLNIVREYDIPLIGCPL